VLSGLPYLVMWLVMIVSGFAADALRSKKILRTTTVRKLCNAIGLYRCHPNGAYKATQLN